MVSVMFYLYILPFDASDDRRKGLALSIGPNWVGFLFLRTETESSLRNFVLNKNKTINDAQKSKLLFNIYYLIFWDSLLRVFE
jgi:hypothetical protein